ncbi:U3 small nucleolar RNA-associated protein 6-domain-containing protein [Trametes maxima]|nr:U3 small nucleolar RNA-associated protein 6-domain-containing protein [Trametes maxima]
MERVQFQQEQMLAELKDLVQKGLFTQKEIKQIMQKRTAFETALVRRIPKKSDFLRYATYEMSLEALRKKRVERLKLPKGPPSVSDYALVKRQFQIFERALKKFKGDVGLWIQYIQIAKKEGARALVGRITARALQLHPNVPALYVLAASHELEHLSPSAARALLQRGLRLNSGSVEMWREYVRMELNFVESLRRRWSVLGIDVKGKGKESSKVKTNARLDSTDSAEESGLEDGQDKEAEGMQVDDEELGEDEAARKEIMDGAIVKAVISNAVKALPKIELFQSLHELLSAYPSPPSLRDSLLDHLHALLRDTLPSSPAAIKLAATRRLTPELTGEPLVDTLKEANNVLSDAVRTSSGEAREGVATVYAEFAEEWCAKGDVDDSLKAYLITSVHLLIQQLPAPAPPALLAAHVRLLVRHHASLGSVLLPPKVNSPEKILRVARKYTARAPSSATVWLARLNAEKQYAQAEDVERAWGEARSKVAGPHLEDIWLWGLPHPERSPQHPSPSTHPDTSAPSGSEIELLEHLLHESKRIREPAAAGRAVHEVLLIRYAAATHAALPHLIAHGERHANADVGADADAAAPSGSGSRSVHAQPRNRAAQQHEQDRALRGDENSTAGQQRGQQPDGVEERRAEAMALTEARLARVRRLGTAHVPSARVWAEVFRQEAQAQGGTSAADDGTGGDERVLSAVYEFWRQCDGVEATAVWAEWLLRSGRGKDAVAVVGRARSVLGEAAGEEVERRWRAILEGTETGAGAEGAGEEAEDDAAMTDDADITVDAL